VADVRQRKERVDRRRGRVIGMMTYTESKALMGNVTPAQRARMQAAARSLRRFRADVKAEAARLDAKRAAASVPALSTAGLHFDAATGCYVGPGGVSVCMRADADERLDGRSRLRDQLVEAVSREELSDEELDALSIEVTRALAWRAERRKPPASRAADPAKETPCECEGEPCECDDDDKLDARTIDTREHREHRGNVVDDARARHDARVRDAWMTTSPITPGPKRTLDSNEPRETGYENPYAGYESPYATGYHNPWAGFGNPYSGDTPEELASALRNDGRRRR
jgi:hypothetical protein